MIKTADLLNAVVLKDRVWGAKRGGPSLLEIDIWDVVTRTSSRDAVMNSDYLIFRGVNLKPSH